MEGLVAMYETKLKEIDYKETKILQNIKTLPKIKMLVAVQEIIDELQAQLKHEIEQKIKHHSEAISKGHEVLHDQVGQLKKLQKQLVEKQEASIFGKIGQIGQQFEKAAAEQDKFLAGSEMKINVKIQKEKLKGFVKNNFNVEVSFGEAMVQKKLEQGKKKEGKQEKKIEIEMEKDKKKI